MPWRGPEYEGEFPSLGWQVLDWAETYFQVPDGPLAGQPLTLTDEQSTIVVRWYQLDDRGKFIARRGAVRRSQGWGKSPLLAVLALAELCGPTVYAGWDSAGEPVGMAPITPWIQVAACSEDQTGNTYNALYAMASESELSSTTLDVGITRVFLRNGKGRLEPVTASAGTRLGQRVTYSVLDETHLWVQTNGGHRLAATIRRNAGKMGGRTFESTNAHEPGEDSVAERTYEAAKRGARGLLYDAVEAPWVSDLRDRPVVIEALKVAYGGSAKWVDLERIAEEIADPATDPVDARRFYFSQLVSGSGRPVDIEQWQRLAKPETEVRPGAYIGLGFDGSISDDFTVLYGCTQQGHIFEIGAWGRTPETPEDWRVPRTEVHEKVHETFARYRVGRMLCDSPKWWTEIEGWGNRYKDIQGKPRVLALDTFSVRRFAPACGRFATATREEKGISHDGREDLTLHLAACAKKKVRVNDPDEEEDGRSQFVVVKADTRKIDRAVGAILAYEAAMTMPLREPAQAVDARELLDEDRSNRSRAPLTEEDIEWAKSETSSSIA